MSGAARCLPKLPQRLQFRNFSLQAVLRVTQMKLSPTSSINSKAKLSERRTEQLVDHGVYQNQTEEKSSSPEVTRNELGVQLLSRDLHSQVFRNASFPPPLESYVEIAKGHLKMHGLDPSQGSVLPDISFALPPLQGRTIDQHFYAIGMDAAQPWLGLAKDLASTTLPTRPKREDWCMYPGWTRYSYEPDGRISNEPVEYPMFDQKPEEMFVFDVETLPKCSPYPIMACAVSKNAWYSWVSPWLIGESGDPKHLIPIGDSTVPRVVVGHNVSYDRARIKEEYNINTTGTRFLDTMALHVAVKGISSHQRPAWTKYRKEKTTQIKEAYEAMPVEEDELATKRWEEFTSANSLADVASLHCGITIDKEIRNDFLICTREEIHEKLQDYLNYCATDTAVTHAVFTKTLPAFLKTCPSPVSFAGVLTMGSSLLTVNEQWEKYLKSAERTYNDLSNAVKQRLIKLAEQAMHTRKWEDDPWLSQLDWTPKKAGLSRGVDPKLAAANHVVQEESSPSEESTWHIPRWYEEFQKHAPIGIINRRSILPLLLKVTCDNSPVSRDPDGWRFGSEPPKPILDSDSRVVDLLVKKYTELFGSENSPIGPLNCDDNDLAKAISSKKDKYHEAEQSIATLAKGLARSKPEEVETDCWLKQLDWEPSKHQAKPKPAVKVEVASIKAKKGRVKSQKATDPPVYWPKWYWDLTAPNKALPPGTPDITVRSRIAPILLRLEWREWPLFHSREHGWTFRVDKDATLETRATALEFKHEADASLKEFTEQGYVFYKIPHKDGEKANVGNPLAKSFMQHARDGILTSPEPVANAALDMNAQCSYWISARDRVMNQMVVWQSTDLDIGVPQQTSACEVANMAEDKSAEDVRSADGVEPKGSSNTAQDTTPAAFGEQTENVQPAEGQKWGIILPQVITMGAVTRRAIEKTWLTASNAKKNRVGSELKAMVRSPPGYSIVGADVDSEELWISSVMGDAQFGLHGATALGWMTLEGTKAAGTDLHSKTAKILGISRDQAKVFNYSRIYGAGMRHAVLLLLQANASLSPDEAQKAAERLYASTKGKSIRHDHCFGRKFWHGGMESLVFNKLEEIAMSSKPQTPALGCGVTDALSKEYLPETFGGDYMTSRINWVVQSSGVDYLHLLIVAMDHLIRKYKIHARYLISVHDELRYLVKEEDQYRAALALQIANLWTRSLFAFKLGMSDLPQGVAFFSAVDIDKYLRKEVNMDCVTPSQPTPLPPGESLDIKEILEKTGGGSLSPDGVSVQDSDLANVTDLTEYKEPECLAHRAQSVHWLKAQVTDDFNEVKTLDAEYKELFGSSGKRRMTKNAEKNQLKRIPLGNGQSLDCDKIAEQMLALSAQGPL
ncbi:hypothetical protein WOLCODRAFT_139691 [Wolfiporia cocos MD-104 SS10]|uniref:Mitochondrial DNA polymerase catalytic subunit n=1 Tax=Wolfiporia cocos (strain MD-104) TaxID=742152 RepID=A0A2H3JE91_WOLCO|nr:hypothetical protein WOLCODRAFT_139691 [Wolfiporia cocos MD-104 SS10]